MQIPARPGPAYGGVLVQQRAGLTVRQPGGETATTVYERGLARLVHHEVDHLDGLLYTDRMRTGVEPIPVEKYQRTRRAWVYDGA